MASSITNEALLKAISLYEQGNSASSINRILGNPVRDDSLCRILRKHVSMRHRSITLNECFFDVVNTELSAYWLGFIYADGCVTFKSRSNRLSFTLSVKDIDHLKSFAEDVGSGRSRIYTYQTRNDFERKIERRAKNYNSKLVIDACKFEVYSKRLISSLVLHGAVPQKTFKLCFPESIGFDVVRHFVRGYFDGDGYVSVSGKDIESGFCGTFELLSGIAHHLNISAGITSLKVVPDGNIYRLRIRSKTKNRLLSEYLYHGASRFLNRKKSVFMAFWE